MDSPARNTIHLDLERGWRGGQQQVANLIHHLAGLGVRCTLVCREGEALHRHALAQGWAALPVRSFRQGFRAASALIAREGVGVVHAHAARAHNLGLLLKLRHPGVRLVVSRRVDFHRRRGPLSAWKYRTRLVDRWIAISERVRQVLIEDGVQPGRIELVHSGVDVARCAPPPDAEAVRNDLRREFGLAGDAFVIGNVGAFVPHKDQATLLRAFAIALRERPELALVVAGEGPLRGELEALAAALGIVERLRLPGFREDLPRLMQLFDLFVMSSREEGLGTSVLDAMSAGRPLVVTNAGGLPEMVTPERNGLVVPRENPEALAAAIVRMAGDPALRAACGRANRADVEAFAAPRTAERTLAVYESLF